MVVAVLFGGYDVSGSLASNVTNPTRGPSGIGRTSLGSMIHLVTSWEQQRTDLKVAATACCARLGAVDAHADALSCLGAP